MKILSKIITYIYAIFFAFSVTIVIGLFYLFPKKMHYIRVKWARMHMKLLGVKVEIYGEFDENANMLIANHQSMFDIMLLEAFYPRNIAWIAKKEISEIFFFGKVITMPKMISIDRQNPRDLVNVLKQAKQRLEEDRVISIFPEGTRGSGKKLLNFKKGAQIIADKLDAKVQPIVIIGSKNTLDSQNFSFKRNQVVKIYTLNIVDRSVDNWLDLAKDNMQITLDKGLA